MAGFMDALRARFSPPLGLVPPYEPLGQVVFEGRSLRDDIWGDAASAQSRAGVKVDIESALTSIAVQAAIRVLVNDIGSLPADAYRRSDKGKEELPRPVWMDTPMPLNPNLMWEDHIKQVVFSILTDGNSFTYCLPNVMRPREIRVVRPTDVDIKGEHGEVTYNVKGADRVLTPNEVIHIPWLLRPGLNRGMNPIEAAKQGLGIALAADEFVGNFFGDGTVLSGIIEFPPGVIPEQAQIDEIKADFKKKHQGARKSHAVGALTGGATYKPFETKNRDAQLLELRDQIVEDVARLFGIPPHMLGSQKPGAVGYASVEQRSIDYVQHAILPIVSRIEKGYSRLLGPQQYLKFNMNGLLRGDSAARASFYREMLAAKVMPKEEVRALEDLNPLAEVRGLLETPNNNAADPRYEAVGALIRAGFDPAGALTAVGLPPIKHLGALPVTVQGEPDPQRAVEPAIHLTFPDHFDIPAPIVNVAPPEVNVAPAELTIEPPVVQVTEREQPAPIVNVDLAQVADALTSLRTDITSLRADVRKPRRRRLVADAEGRVIGSEDEEL